METVIFRFDGRNFIPAQSLGVDGFLYCYSTWDDMDKVFDRIVADPGRQPPQLKGFLKATVMKGFNNSGVPYPFTIALVTSKERIQELDDFLCKATLDFGTYDGIYTGEPRMWDFLSFVPITRYPPGFLKILFGRCELKAKNPMACTFCNVGHAMECHFPMDCQEAKCSHLERYE